MSGRLRPITLPPVAATAPGGPGEPAAARYLITRSTNPLFASIAPTARQQASAQAGSRRHSPYGLQQQQQHQHQQQQQQQQQEDQYYLHYRYDDGEPRLSGQTQPRRSAADREPFRSAPYRRPQPDRQSTTARRPALTAPASYVSGRQDSRYADEHGLHNQHNQHNHHYPQQQQQQIPKQHRYSRSTASTGSSGSLFGSSSSSHQRALSQLLHDRQQIQPDTPPQLQPRPPPPSPPAFPTSSTVQQQSFPYPRPPPAPAAAVAQRAPAQPPSSLSRGRHHHQPSASSTDSLRSPSSSSQPAAGGLPSLNLPSIRTIESQPAQQSPILAHHHHHHHYNPPFPLPPPPLLPPHLPFPEHTHQPLQLPPPPPPAPAAPPPSVTPASLPSPSRAYHHPPHTHQINTRQKQQQKQQQQFHQSPLQQHHHHHQHHHQPQYSFQFHALSPQSPSFSDAIALASPSLLHQSNHMASYYQSAPHSLPHPSATQVPQSLTIGLPAAALPPGEAAPLSTSPHGIVVHYPSSVSALDHRSLSAARQKKEIKRRTKTGCLTCRKRRIKCDETHPSCRNCQKSKRECLGYDPIFKQQPGPPQIQPAPSGGPANISRQSSISTSPVGVNALTPSFPQPGNNTLPPSDSASSAVSSSSTSHNPYVFDTTIDPALGTASNPSFQAAQYAAPHPMHALQAQTGESHAPPQIADSLVTKAKSISADELLSSFGNLQTRAQSNETVGTAARDEIRLLYLKDYADGLDRFLETSWYSATSLSRLMSDTQLCSMFATLIHDFKSADSKDLNGIARIASLEIRLVWHLISLCRKEETTSTASGGATDPAVAAGSGNSTSHSVDTADDHVKRRTAASRLTIFEALITNRPLEVNPATPPKADDPPDLLVRYPELEFWQQLGAFTAIQHPGSLAGIADAEAALHAMRKVLSQLENRDVLYSMAVARHYGLRAVGFPKTIQQAFSNSDADPLTKLVVAKRFIEYEAGGRGTTQVIQRLCGLAVRSWTLIRSDDTVNQSAPPSQHTTTSNRTAIAPELGLK